MDLPEVMVLLDSPLEEGDPHSSRDLVSVNDKPIQQMKFLFELTEKLACSSFATVSETEVGDVDGQSHNFMLATFDSVW